MFHGEGNAEENILSKTTAMGAAKGLGVGMAAGAEAPGMARGPVASSKNSARMPS